MIARYVNRLFCVTIYLLMDIWDDVSTFWLLRIMLLSTFAHMFACF